MRQELTVTERVAAVRVWLAENVDRETLEFPDEDRTWDYITTTWATLSTDAAEKVLCEAMKPIWTKEQAASVDRPGPAPRI